MNRTIALHFDNRYARLPGALFSRCQPDPLPDGALVVKSRACAELLDLQDISEQQLVALTTGRSLPAGAEPLAQKYTGHQFGVYNPDLGDGRGLLLGEVINARGERLDLHLKGAGKTPYSRMGDGRAVLRSSIREFLASEALFHLGIPTTRALCVTSSSLPVYREREETAATLLRVSGSHLRFGHFEYLHHSGQPETLRQLIDYALEHLFSPLRSEADPVLALFREVVSRTAALMAQWQAIGFAHGVMNSDNFSLLGDTFDFGPYAFMDAFNPGLICNHSDWQGRYAFNKQPQIGLWNLNCLAVSFSGLLKREQLVAALQEYEEIFHQHYLSLLGGKIGLSVAGEDDAALIGDLLTLMAQTGADYSRTFRALADIDSKACTSRARDEFSDAEAFDNWCKSYIRRLERDPVDDDERYRRMMQRNPKYILRNYLAQQAIEKAQQGDFSEVQHLHELLCNPFDEQPENNKYAALPPDWGRDLEISCSS